jgi:hypothetical protein
MFMNGRIQRVFVWPALAAVLTLLAAVPAAADDQTGFKAGFTLEHFSRKVSWNDEAETSKSSANLFAARAEIAASPGLIFDFTAGFALSNFNGLVFDTLPISLDYEAGGASGVVIGAGLRARIARFNDFEIEGAARFVYCLKLNKTWTLDDFAVPGTAAGGPTWMRISAGPRLLYHSTDKFTPYLGVSADWFSGHFELAETIGDLSGQEKKKIKGKSLVDIALGGDYKLSDRVTLRAEAGFLPYGGGVDADLAVGFLYNF